MLIHVCILGHVKPPNWFDPGALLEGIIFHYI